MSLIAEHETALSPPQMAPAPLASHQVTAGRMQPPLDDPLSDVLALTGADIRPPPEMGPAVAEAAIIGLSTLDQRMLMIVDIEQCMSSPAMQLVG